MVDKNDFFREFTTRICCSLLMDTALEAVCDYLKQIMPLDMVFIARRDDALGALRMIARANVNPTSAYSGTLPLPKSLWLQLQAYNRESPYIVDKSDEFHRQIGILAGLEGYSHLFVPLSLDGNHLGALSMIVKGENLYNQSHLDLFSATSQPASIALSNAIAHEDLMRYRDALIDENQFLNKELHNTSTGEIIGENGGLKHVIELVRQVAPLNNTVLLLGETGTGKEVIANAIHFASQRKDGPFIKVNCGAIPENLIDSELFGHEKGAFTGATAEKKGRFERASGGTIFLDEIGELPQQAQVRLLRVVQNREIERVGGTRPIPVDIRIIAATHRNLEGMVSENRFREDLWFRLNVFPLIIPPLRQRREDIPNLTNYFLKLKSRELGLKTPPAIAPGVLSRLADYPWPGNARELENLVERELIRHQGGPLTFETLEPNKRLNAAPFQANDAHTQQPTNLDQAMHNHIEMVLRMSGGRIQGPHGAAVLLGIKASTLRARMDKLGIRYGRAK